MLTVVEMREQFSSISIPFHFSPIILSFYATEAVFYMVKNFLDGT
jgi:hypothetical protein